MQGLNHGQYKIGKPGYVQLEKAKTLAAKGCPLDAVLELLTPFIGISPHNMRGDHVDFDHSEQQLHPLRNVLVIPAHKVDARVPKSCILLGGLHYENKEDEDSEMDRWFLQCLHDHNLKPKAEVTDLYKTDLLYDLNDAQERHDFVYKVLEERNERRKQFSATHIDQHKWRGKYCPERRYKVPFDEEKTERRSALRERGDHCLGIVSALVTKGQRTLGRRRTL